MKKKKQQEFPKDYIITSTGTKLLITNVTDEYYICGVRYISREDILSGKCVIITEQPS
jgi:hypothetical protein